MRSWGVVAAAMGVLLGQAGVSTAEDSPAAKPAEDQIYIAAVISKAGKPVAMPNITAGFGRDGKLTFYAQPDPNGAGPFGLKFRADRIDSDRIRVAVSAQMNEKDVASRTVEITNEAGATSTFRVNGYSWELKIDYLSEDFVASGKADRPVPFP
jgi:hypothetical protein